MAEKTDNGKPRGACTGCKFDYQLGTARKGDYKGQLVIRKHLSRTGPGLCEGAQKPPKGADPEMCACGGQDPDCPNGCGTVAFVDPAPVAEPYITAAFDSTGSCGHEIMAGEEIRGDGEGGYLCGLCSDEGAAPDRPQHVYDNGNGGVYVHEGLLQSCAQDECAAAREATAPVAEALPHDRTPETITHTPDGHDYDDGAGGVWRHGGPFAECTTPECVQFRNRINPPPVTTPVQHQCSHGLYANIRNCPRHGVPTPVEKLPVAVAPGGVPVFVDPHEHEATSAMAAVKSADMAQFVDPVPAGMTDEARNQAYGFADPAPAPADLPSVSGQPEPDRDRWGRYLIMGEGHTRATTFAKLGSSTYALGEWNERMLAVGLTRRPDLLAMLHGLDVKRDRSTINKIVDDAQEFAGNKVAANIGTAYHSFTERLDAGLCSLDEVPEQWRTRCRQYVEALARHGLTTRREWIERTTAVRADQVSAPAPVAGTLDRIFQLPNGDLVIGDLKTSSNIEYSWSEIAVQLALYAHGVNTHGLFDWNTKMWEPLTQSVDLPAPIRTDYAIVMHLPADGDGCELYRVDLVKGWQFAQVSGLVQARQKAKDVAGPLLPQTIQAPVPARLEPTRPEPTPETPEMENARRVVASATDASTLAPLYDYAVSSGLYSPAQLDQIKAACAARWSELQTA